MKRANYEYLNFCSFLYIFCIFDELLVSFLYIFYGTGGISPTREACSARVGAPIRRRKKRVNDDVFNVFANAEPMSFPCGGWDQPGNGSCERTQRLQPNCAMFWAEWGDAVAVLPCDTLAFPFTDVSKSLFTKLFQLGKHICQQLVFLFRSQGASTLALYFW